MPHRQAASACATAASFGHTLSSPPLLSAWLQLRHAQVPFVQFPLQHSPGAPQLSPPFRQVEMQTPLPQCKPCAQSAVSLQRVPWAPQ